MLPNRSLLTPLLGLTLGQLASSAPGRPPSPPAQTAVTVFDGVHVVSMERDGIDRDRVVLVRDGRIEAIGSRNQVKVPAGATRIDARGKYLMPGLHDMHAHLAQGTGENMDAAQRQLTVYLAFGVTTVRALAAPPSGFEVKRRANNGELLAPHLFITGQSINAQSAATPEAVTALVKQMASLGADVIKTHGMWKSPEPYAALVEATREAKLPLAGHVTPEFGIERAMEAGQQIEHLDGMIAATVPPGTAVPPGQFVFDEAVLAQVDSARVDALARRMAQRGIYHGPTLALFRIFAGTESAESLRARPDTMFTPRQALDQWTLQRSNQLQQPLPTSARERYLAVRDMMVRRLQAHGVPLLAGSDGPQFFMVPGFGLHRELEALVQAGLTPYEALSAATRTPATYLGRGAVTGTIAVGKQADLVLLDANPLENISNARRIQGTMLRGRWLDRAALDNMERRVTAAVRAL